MASCSTVSSAGESGRETGGFCLRGLDYFLWWREGGRPTFPRLIFLCMFKLNYRPGRQCSKIISLFSALLALALLLLGQADPLGHLHQLGHVEAVHVVDVRIDSARLLEVDVVALIDELDESFLTYLHAGVDYLHVAFLEGVVDHFLVLERRDRTGGVDDGPAHSGAVDGCQDQLLLDVGVLVDVEQQSVGLDGVVLRDDAEAGAGGVEQDAVEGAGEDEGVLAAVAAGDDRVGDAETVEVELEGLQSLLLQVVREDTPSVLHQLGDIGRLAARGRGQVQHPLADLRVEGEHGQEGGSALQHVVAGQVLGRGTDGHFRLVDLDADLAPLGKRVEIGPSLDETLGQFFSPGLESVCTDGERTLSLVGLEKLYQLGRVEEVEEVVDEFEVVPVVPVQKAPQLFDVVLARTAFAQFGDVHEDVDGLLDLQVDHADVHWFVVLLLVLLWGSVAVHLLVHLLPLLSLSFPSLLVLVVVFLVEIFA